MFSTLTVAAAWFAFGYCVTDFIQNFQSNKRVNAIVKDILKPKKRNTSRSVRTIH